MSTQKFLLSCTVSLAILALTIPPRVMAATNQCVGGQYTITYQGQDKITYPGQIAWKYSGTSSQTGLTSLKRVVMIVPRPVVPANIISPIATLGYCTQEDSNTKINRGNCNGFPVPIQVTKTDSSFQFQIVTPNTVKEGLVSLSTVNGTSSSDICINMDDPLPKGIPGPAIIDALIHPVASEKCTIVQGTETSILTKYGPDSCVTEVTAFENSNCSMDGSEVFLPWEQVPPNLRYLGPADGGLTCPSTLETKTGSPCYLNTLTSGGKTYKYCVDAATGKIVDTSLCTTHTGVCQ
jgi:hypothetical protein